MAITRAQQYRQMLEDGGMLVSPSTTGRRPGYRNPTKEKQKYEKQAAINRENARAQTVDLPKKSTFRSFVEDEPNPADREANTFNLETGRENSSGGPKPIGGNGITSQKDKFNIFDIMPAGIAKNFLKKINESKFVQGLNFDNRKRFMRKLAETDPLAFQKLVGELEDQDLTTVNEDTITSPSQRIGASDFSLNNYLDFDGTLAGSPDFKGIFDEYGYKDYQNRFEKLRAPDDNPDSYLLQQLAAQQKPLEDNTVEETLSPIQQAIRDRGIASAFLATGGRVGLAKGSRMQSGEAKESRKKSSTPTNPNKRTGAVDEKTTDPRITPGGDGPTRSITNDEGIGLLTTKKDIPTFNNDITRINLKDLIGLGLDDQEEENIQLAKVYGAPELTEFGATPGMFKDTAKFNDMEKYQEIANKQFEMGKKPSDIRKSINLGSSLYGIDMDNIPKDFLETTKDFENQKILGKIEFAEGGRAGFAGGGMPYEGGIMDLESGRQMYFLGKLVKKATRAVKKIAKSPIGKAALLYAGGTYLGGLSGVAGTTKSMGFLESLRTPSNLGNLFNFGKSYITDAFGEMSKKDRIKLGLGAGLTLAPLLFQEDTNDEDYQKFLAERGVRGTQLPASPSDIRKNYRDYISGTAFLADGGTPEPVAKKTMPLLDMDGQEMDFRAEGGFVPIGRMEKADDVPARLSKNEFVFTADAVRNAGEGDIDKGAEVMYNMMKNLESGGDVSEESQGLEGARNMFQTSQRLEEVL